VHLYPIQLWQLALYTASSKNSLSSHPIVGGAVGVFVGAVGARVSAAAKGGSVGALVGGGVGAIVTATAAELLPARRRPLATCGLADFVA